MLRYLSFCFKKEFNVSSHKIEKDRKAKSYRVADAPTKFVFRPQGSLGKKVAEKLTKQGVAEVSRLSPAKESSTKEIPHVSTPNGTVFRTVHESNLGVFAKSLTPSDKLAKVDSATYLSNPVVHHSTSPMVKSWSIDRESLQSNKENQRLSANTAMKGAAHQYIVTNDEEKQAHWGHLQAHQMFGEASSDNLAPVTQQSNRYQLYAAENPVVKTVKKLEHIERADIKVMGLFSQPIVPGVIDYHVQYRLRGDVLRQERIFINPVSERSISKIERESLDIIRGELLGLTQNNGSAFFDDEDSKDSFDSRYLNR